MGADTAVTDGAYFGLAILLAACLTGCKQNDLSADATSTQRNTLGPTQSGTSAAAPCLGLPPNSTPAACYALSLITALGEAHRAAITPSISGGEENPVTLATEVFYVSRMQRRGVERAISPLRPYLTALDSSIRKNAKEIIQALTILRDVSIKGDSVLVRQLDKGESRGTGSVAQELADLKAQRHDGAYLLMLGVVGLTHAMVQPDISTGLSMLSISSQEREALLGELDQQFPSGLKATKAGSRSSDYAAAASMLDGFLRQQWKTQR